MQQELITRIKLTASEGHVLTNGENYVLVHYVGANDSVDNWREITEAEAAELQKPIEVEEEE